MAESFKLTQDIDFAKITNVAKGAEVFIGFPSGMMHTPSHGGESEDMAELAKKLSVGYAHASFDYVASETYGQTKSGKPKKRKVYKHGYANVPARPFLVDGLSNGKPNILKRIEKYWKAKLDGKDGNTELHAVAVTAVGEVQDFVKGDYYKSTAPNNDMTIEAKKSDTPLIDTAQMINSLTYVINEQTYQKVKNEETGKKEWVVK